MLKHRRTQTYLDLDMSASEIAAYYWMIRSTALELFLFSSLLHNAPSCRRKIQTSPSGFHEIVFLDVTIQDIYKFPLLPRVCLCKVFSADIEIKQNAVYFYLSATNGIQNFGWYFIATLTCSRYIVEILHCFNTFWHKSEFYEGIILWEVRSHSQSAYIKQ